MMRGMNRTVIWPHPGEILCKEFCEPLRISQRKLSAATGISRRQIGRLADGEIDITPVHAECLGRFFGTTSAFWTNLQSAFDLALTKDALAETLDRTDGASGG